MSRAPPFPTNYRRHADSPPQVNGNGQANTPFPTQIRPLQINRLPSRPNTPSNTSTSPRGSATSPGGPSRPQRSELRTRQVSEYSTIDRTSSPSRITSDIGDRRDSGSTTRSNASVPYRSRKPSSTTTASSNTYSKAKNDRSRTVHIEDSEKSPNSPTALPSVMAAFQSAGARKRAMTNGSDDLEYERDKKKEVELEKLRQQRIRDKAPGRKTNGKARAGDIDAILDQIKDEWEFVIDPDFNNVDLALQLLDNSSLGKDIVSFRRTKKMLSMALKGSVDKHYQAFQAAIPHHASLLNHLGVTQTQITESRTSLQEARDALGSKRADLVQLWSRGQTVDEMIQILDQIEYLKAVPDVLETLMSEKRLLQASVILVRSLKMINSQDMLEVGAVADLRSYLVGQETALREILVDELHSHLYLKSFWCESRWSSYTPNQQTFVKVDFEDEPLPSELLSVFSGSLSLTAPSNPRPSRLARFLNDLSLRPNDPPHDLEEANLRQSASAQTLSSVAMPSMPSTTSFTSLVPSFGTPSQNSRNPEADSFSYLETVLESLAVLGKLGNALDIVAQRLPSEVFALVDATLEDVGERAEYGRRGALSRTSVVGTNVAKLDNMFAYVSGKQASGLKDTNSSQMALAQNGLLSASSLRLAALESSAKHVDHEILKDLFWTVYSKLDALAQGLRVIYEVANRIGTRREFKDSSGTKPGALFPLIEVWAPVQAEVRTLLNDYLTDEEQGAVSGRNPISSINEILREGRFNRDKAKPVFRFADTDIKLSNKALKQHEDELTRVLRDTMPGLVHGPADNTAQITLSTVGTDDRLLGAGQHHRLLIKPDAFHVSVLFQPTLAFLDRVKEILPFGIEAYQSSNQVLDEFVLKVYLPQLEEKVSSLFHQAVTGPEAFQPDPSSKRFSHEPLVKASTQLMALINSLCAMLRTTPFHRESYSRMILGVIIQFYQRCSDRFQDLVSLRGPGASESDTRLALAAQWAQKAELNPCLSELLTATDDAKKQPLFNLETSLEFELLGQKTISKDDLMVSTRSLAALCSLYRSVTWFTAKLNLLKASQNDALSPTTPLKLEPLSSTTPYTPYLPVPPPSLPDEQLKLPLSREMALRFQALLRTYDQLAELILYSIRIDIRCRTIHYLDCSMRHGNYHAEREAGEPDPHIVDLNAELNKCDDFASSALPQRDREFIFAGLGQVMEYVLIANARHLRLVNHFGIKKITRNMLALQQGIKTITNDPKNSEFDRAKRFYSLFFLSPLDMLHSVRENPAFSFDDYKTMLSLQCGVDPAGGDEAIAHASDRNYNMYVIDLHGLELEKSADEVGS